jgi:hypothetical protein
VSIHSLEVRFRDKNIGQSGRANETFHRLQPLKLALRCRAVEE